MNRSGFSTLLEFQQRYIILPILKSGRWGHLCRRIIVVPLIIFVIIISSVCSGRTEKSLKITPSYFLTGNQYLKQKAEIRFTYILGLYDGIQLAKIFGAKGKIYDYIEGMTGPQIATIVDKYLKENPAQWHEPMNLIFFLALQPPKRP